MPEPSPGPAAPRWPISAARALLLHHVAAELASGRCRGGERHPMLDEDGEAEVTDTLTSLALGVGDRETFRDVAGQNIGLSSEETDASEALVAALAGDPSPGAVLDALELSPRLRAALARLTPDARALAVRVALDGAEGDAYQLLAGVRAIAAFLVALDAGVTR